jgi:hypothetical protein
MILVKLLIKYMLYYRFCFGIRVCDCRAVGEGSALSAVGVGPLLGESDEAPLLSSLSLKFEAAQLS